MAEISKSELARLLEIDRSTVTRMKGLPVRANGRLDRNEALAWIRMYCSSHGGGWTTRKGGPGIAARAEALLLHAEGSAPTAEAPLDLKDPGTRGFRAGARHCWFAMRANLPGLLAPWKLSLRWKMTVLALIDTLHAEWLMELELDPPEIDWSAYGEQATEAAEQYRGWLEYFAQAAVQQPEPDDQPRKKRARKA